MLTHWDFRFLCLAELVAGWSKDPSTQVGAVVVRPDKTVASLGFNGFPRGVKDDHRLDDRAIKYELVVHAEMNALLHAREPLRGCTLYVWPLPPCSRCASCVVQAGIIRVVAPPPLERWAENCALSAKILREAGVELVLSAPPPL